jgi:hypothetical protein
MYESPDNPASRPDIDGLFQKLARDYEPPFDPAAWQQMQQKLDQVQPPARPFGQARRLLLLLAVLLVVGSQLQSRTGLGRPVRSQPKPSLPRNYWPTNRHRPACLSSSGHRRSHPALPDRPGQPT